MAKLFSGFFVSIIAAEDTRPLGPRVVFGAFFGGLVEEFEVDQLRATVPQACSDAIATGITPADDNDSFAFGGDKLAVGVVAIEETSGVGREEFHGEVNTAERATWDRQIAGFGRTGGQ